ncbi:MAG: DUF2142 domain-containing protein [Bacilli bacterium]|nr:DUF2142 domain-containing protein [Bacilli bacterium]
MKKKITYLLIFIILSFLSSLFIEIVIVNNEVLFQQSEKKPEIIETSGMINENGYYVTTTENSYIRIRIKKKYINKIKFNYRYNENFNWICSYIKNNKEVKINKSSSYITGTAVKKVNDKTEDLKLSFNNKNIKIRNIEIDNHIYIYWNRVLTLFLVLCIVSFLIIFNKKINSFKTQNLFLFLSILFGILFVLVTPKHVYTSFDDQIHFSHSLNPFKREVMKYSYTEEIVEHGAFINKTTFFETKEEKNIFYRALNKIHKKTKNRYVQVVNDRSFYGNLVYLPFFLGYKISNMINLNFTTCFMMGKIFNLILYSFIFYLAIKYAKYGKKMVFMVAMIPECLFFATQYSYDSTIIAGLSLATVCFINIMSEEKINKKYVMIFIISTLWASLPKALYCPFLLLLLFIPNNKFNDKRQAIIFKLLIIFLTILILSTFVLPVASGQMTADERGDNASVSGQIDYIINNPISFIKTIIIFTFKNAWDKMLGYKNFVHIPYLVTTNIFKYTYYFYLIPLIYYSLASNISIKIDKKIKSLLLLEIIGIWLLFCVALYLKFTKVGLNTISGIVPRYMLPTFVAFFYLFMKPDRKKETNNYLYIIIPITYLSLILLYLSIKVI